MSGFKLAVIINGISNYGGKEIAKRLAQFFDGHIYLTGTDVKLINDIQIEIRREYFLKNIKCTYLDTSDNNSIEKFQTLIREYYGAVDIYINYEGINDYDDKIETMNGYELAEYCLDKNYHQVKKTDSWMFKLLTPNAKVIHLVNNFRNSESTMNVRLIYSDDLTEIDLDNLLQNYLRNLKQQNIKNTNIDLDTKINIETISRMALMQLTKIQQRMFNQKHSNISINIVITNHIVGTCLDKNYRHILTERQLADISIKMALRKYNSIYARKGKLIIGLRDIVVF